MRANHWILIVGVILGVGMSANAQQVSAPSGWSDDTDGTTRILTKNTSRIEIGPWENLQGASLERWLDARKSEVPTNVQLVSSKAIKKETSGSTEYFYINQRTKINGKGWLWNRHRLPRYRRHGQAAPHGRRKYEVW